MEAGGASEDRNGGGGSSRDRGSGRFRGERTCGSGSPRSMVPPNLVGSSEDPRLHEEAQRRGSCPQRNKAKESDIIITKKVQFEKDNLTLCLIACFCL